MTPGRGELAERIAALPGARLLLPALSGVPPSFLVGGAVRDLLRGADHVDLDLAVEGDAVAAARTVAARVGGRAVEHERFGTATVEAPGIAVDMAATRRERYPRPGALPEVEPAPLVEDLARRDFTVNAMAAALGEAELGRLVDPHGGRADLERGALRVLHDRSFVDDPTRLLRAVRYETRLGLRMDPHTEALAREAAATGALDSVSGERVRDGLLDLLGEAEMAVAVTRLRELGLDRALNPNLSADPDAVASAALAAADTGADRVLAALAALVASDPEALVPWLEGLGLPAPPRDRAARSARRGPELASELRAELSPSALHELLTPEPAEALAVALGRGAPAEPLLSYLSDLRGVRLEIGGRDLVEAGVPESPAVGRALAATLRRKLDGEVSGREEELSMALRIAREGER